MVGVLGGMLVFAMVVVAGMWATIRSQREQIKAKDGRIAELVDHVPPRAVQFVVDGPAVFGVQVDDRATDVGAPPMIDLAAMGNDRKTLA